jgi:hypothetical protein
MDHGEDKGASQRSNCPRSSLLGLVGMNHNCMVEKIHNGSGYWRGNQKESKTLS